MMLEKTPTALSADKWPKSLFPSKDSTLLGHIILRPLREKILLELIQESKNEASARDQASNECHEEDNEDTV